MQQLLDGLMIARYVVHGVVQGVGYRAYVKSCALRHGIRGTVQNQQDGSVLIVAQAQKDSLEAFERSIDVSTLHGVQVMNIEKSYDSHAIGEFEDFRIVK